MTDFGDIDGTVWLDGRLVDWRDARIHFLSHGLQYAGVVFEGERAYDGRIFKLREHTDRLFSSAEIMGYRIPFDREAIDRACHDVLAANGLRDGYIRPCAWRGSDRLGPVAGWCLGPRGHRGLELAQLLLAGAAHQRHQAHERALAQTFPGHRTDPCEGVGPLSDIHPLEAIRGRTGL